MPSGSDDPVRIKEAHKEKAPNYRREGILQNESEKTTARILSGALMKGLKTKTSWVPVTHTCNPGYSGGRDQENRGLKPAWANSSRDSISKIPNKKRVVEWLKM
jgi:hypothetical protein